MTTNAAVVAEVLSDDSVAHNVEYDDEQGSVVLKVACGDKEDAAVMALLLNKAAWVEVDDGGTVAK